MALNIESIDNGLEDEILSTNSDEDKNQSERSEAFQKKGEAKYNLLILETRYG